MTVSTDDSKAEIFGEELGRAPGNVPAYSSDYASADPEHLPTRHHYRHYVDGVYTGHKWQCVEFARRWLLENKGYVFDDIAMAYDIFRLNSVKTIADQKRLPLYAFENGSLRRPEPGCMLIWNEGGEFEVTGHVAIVTAVFDDCLRVAEQNVGHCKWPEGHDYARELRVSIDNDGSYWVDCSFPDASILGWVIQTDDPTHAVIEELPEQTLFLIQLKDADYAPQKKSWLNIARPDEAAYVARNGHKLCSLTGRESQYLAISRTAAQELKRASNELHALFMHATDFVMERPELQARFNIPEAVWPRIRQSWANRRNQMITGRFDFCMTEQGLKVYEYNCDSASCHMEAGKVQELWARQYHCDDGDDAGEELFDHLVDAWRAASVEGLIHLLLDDEEEEIYHCLFMREAMARAGLKTRLVQQFGSTRWVDREVRDDENNAIRTVWKTWAWETALDELREELNTQAAETDSKYQQTPRLMDVLLQPSTMVFEPLWTLVPSNKAILPVLWEMFPDYPYLLESHFQLTPELESRGYVAKPIAGRCGHNISIVDRKAQVVSETAGRFVDQETIYQALSPLPQIDGLRVQICTFTAGGSYAGSCARVDESLIITTDSELMPLRILSDRQFQAG